jgi:hypothetical protein
MVGWPQRVRSLTNPDSQEFATFARAGSSLVSYRLTGLGFILISLIMIQVLISRIQ